MSTAKDEPPPAEMPAADPLAQMLQFYDAFAKSWASVMSQTVASPRFAETMGKQVESSLDAVALMRRQVGEVIEQSLQQMSLPTRKEVAGIAERLTRLEMAVDDLNAKLDEALDLLKSRHD
jgi:hypothetical protein